MVVIVSHGVDVDVGVAELEDSAPVLAVVPEPAPVYVTPAELLRDRLGNVVVSRTAEVLPEELVVLIEPGTTLLPIVSLPHARVLVELKPQPLIVLPPIVPTSDPNGLDELLPDSLTAVDWEDVIPAVPLKIVVGAVSGELRLIISVPEGKKLVELKPQPVTSVCASEVVVVESAVPFAMVVGVGSNELLSEKPVPKGREVEELKPQPVTAVNGEEAAVAVTSSGLAPVV
jgi:hypothetical protein